MPFDCVCFENISIRVSADHLMFCFDLGFLGVTRAFTITFHTYHIEAEDSNFNLSRMKRWSVRKLPDKGHIFVYQEWYSQLPLWMWCVKLWLSWWWSAFEAFFLQKDLRQISLIKLMSPCWPILHYPVILGFNFTQVHT